tara:strand:- start:372 stop:1028 length:657 start_codon:yes stop_codon:yes gene_type:complete
MAWSMPDESEMFSLDTMLEHFDLKRISLGGPIFDTTKLDWLNGTWIREELDDDAFADSVAEWALNRENLKRLIPLVRPRVNKWSELAPMLGFFLDGLMPLTPEKLQFKGLEDGDVRKIYAYSLWTLDALPSWDSDSIQAALRGLATTMDLKLRVFLAPFFMAIAGKSSSTPLFNTMALLGKDMCRARLRHALDTLKPMSGKEQGRWRKEYDALMASCD